MAHPRAWGLWTVDNLRIRRAAVKSSYDRACMERESPSVADQIERALIVSMPLRHLEAASSVCQASGSVVLPAGGPGDLDEALGGSLVLLIAIEAGDREVPAATWAATFEERIPHAPGDPLPSSLPASWIDEHGRRTVLTDASDPVGSARDDDDDDEDDDEEIAGTQSFFRVSALTTLPREEWVFANELVPKQQRGGRSFAPRTPRLIARPV